MTDPIGASRRRATHSLVLFAKGKEKRVKPAACEDAAISASACQRPNMPKKIFGGSGCGLRMTRSYEDVKRC